MQKQQTREAVTGTGIALTKTSSCTAPSRISDPIVTWLRARVLAVEQPLAGACWGKSNKLPPHNQIMPKVNDESVKRFVVFTGVLSFLHIIP